MHNPLVSIDLQSLLDIIFDEDESLAAARSAHVRREFKPFADMPSRVISADLASAITTLDPDEVFTHIQTYTTPTIIYHVLWQKHAWLESCERLIQAKLNSSERIRQNQHKYACEERLHAIALKLHNYFGHTKEHWARYVNGLWREADGAEEIFKASFDKLHAVFADRAGSFYIPPPSPSKSNETTPQEEPTHNAESNQNAPEYH